MTTHKTLPILVLMTISPTSLASCGGMESDSTLGPNVADEPTFRSDGWQRFPIVIDGVTVHDMDIQDPYKFELEPNVFIELADFADVATRWNSFQPCDWGALTDEQNALESFFYGHPEAGVSYIETAEEAGLHVILPLPFIGSTSYKCSGFVDVAPDPDELWKDDQKTIRIPVLPPNAPGGYALAKNMITPAFTSYWADKAAYYVDAINDYDTENAVWRWRVIEELRPSVANEYAFALTVRDTVNTHDGTRPMVAYTPGHYLPNGDMMYSLLEKGATATTEKTFELGPSDPVARRAKNGAVGPLYPDYITVERDGGKYLIQLFDDVLTGVYTGLGLGGNAHENRIHPYHRIRLGAEALKNIEDVYSANSATESISQDPPEHILFHAPDLTMSGPAQMSADEARHDFWAGIHEARGVWIHSMSYRDASAEHEAAWEEYVRALYLIKQEMRPYLAGGSKTTPTLTHDGTQTDVPSDYYIDIGNWGNRHDLAMPESPDQYSVINHTLFKISNVGYLIVTHSWDQEVEFEVEFADCIDSAQIVSGASANLTTNDDLLSDTFDGIDGRVYKITFEDCQ